MFKNTRLSAFFAAVLLSVTATTALVAAPAFADAPASAAATAPAADAAAAPAPAADAAAPAADAAAPAADAAAPAKTEEVHNPFGLQAVWDGGFVPRATLIILAIMSIGSWYIIITKLMDQMKIFKQAKETAAKFWKAPSIAAGSATLTEGSPFRFIAESGTKATAHHDGALLEQIDLSTWVTMSIQRASDKVQSRLQDGLSFLATVGSTAPFIGLFGTVWGIYGALTNIGMTGNASIDKVAGPVGEALIMTAFGLLVAVPAVLGYNWLVRRNKTAMEDVRSFSADVHSVLISGAMSTSEAGRAAGAKKIG
ncbi:Biopolymer transport protein ExbB [compost metagenome]|jgi:biopolymer transport protein ExbB|uniref:Biopolymer transport protein ExbB n=1 Tax=Janthinobacterium aestuarii TaxID=2985511 RepID=A0ABZ2GNU7_9BURK|nr:MULTISPECIES: MotA/TolQ/ExbB proton channel family protein [Janthinobacterium]EZP37837.1 Biopolymer transport protein ExbB [Janthinobacterium lividum]MBW3497977.1 MotA/TolQ/ExbB proton channel family protein [Janthinobacterium sp. NKUCC08_JDC]MDX8120970.1 MotA/TolQ/ExbB proton channel family protein [Janthinobacterium sp. GMG2]|eukprot:TRINITY_DN982_c0_g1_i1.p1 TRINITY_DN982_c0_g1~~TRINITY_DN982_c0_g1_i1.p1  ORF type:complete len:311 (-),score=57.68 TRINITY_DN982_c0_g1_i1:1287-2219(-)